MSNRKICWCCGVAKTTNCCDRCSRGLPTITLWEPWASLIAFTDFKLIETRTHNRFAGLKHKRIAIHVARRFDPNAVDQILRYSAEASRFVREMIAGKMNGKILCTIFVEEARPLRAADSRKALCDCSDGDLFGLILGRKKEFEKPFEAKGHQGIWTWKPVATEDDQCTPHKQNELF